MSKFGWSLPPGVTHRQIDEAYGVEGVCAVCGKVEDACICPECPVCDSIGDPDCYERHGLVRSPEQIASLKEAEAQWRAEADRMTEGLLETAETLERGFEGGEVI